MSRKILSIVLMITILASTLTVLNGYMSTALTTNPVSLEINVAPINILADNSTYNCIFVQLVDSNRIPVRAQKDTIISLSTSAPKIGTVDVETIIPKNQTYASANFTSTYLPGNTTITATSNDYDSVQADVATIGPYPYRTAVYGPSLFPANGQTYDCIVVQLQDLSGNPVRAPNDVPVYLFSNDTAIGTVSSSIMILEGQTYAQADFLPTLASGACNITVMGPGYASSSMTIVTQDATLSGSANQIQLFEGPPKVLADNTSYRQVVVELQDSLGNVAQAPYSTTVTLTVADNTTGTIDFQMTIPQFDSLALVTMYTTYRPGIVNITSAANNLHADSQQITAVGYVPSNLTVYCAPSKLPSDNSTYESVQVQLQDEQGNPARNPDSDTIVRLFSSDSAVAAVDAMVTIPYGKTQTTANLNTTLFAGTTTLTAIASNYTTGQINLTTCLIDLRPLNMTETVNPQAVNGGELSLVKAYLHSDGVPVTEATVVFSSNNGGTFTAVTDHGNGTYSSVFTAPNAVSAIEFDVTASAEKYGYFDAQDSLLVSVAPAPSPTPSPSPTAATTSSPTPTESPSPSPTVTPTPTPGTGTNSSANLQFFIKDSYGNPLNGTIVQSTNATSWGKLPFRYF